MQTHGRPGATSVGVVRPHKIDDPAKTIKRIGDRLRVPGAAPQIPGEPPATWYDYRSEIPLPDECISSANDNGTWWATRFFGCSLFEVLYQVWDFPDKKPPVLSGEAVIVNLQFVGLNAKTQQWDANLVQTMDDSWGTAVEVAVLENISCSNNCTITGPPAPRETDLNILASKGIYHPITYKTKANSTINPSVGIRMTYYSRVRGVTTLASIDIPANTPRCDSKTEFRSSGCVFAYAPAWFNTLSTYPGSKNRETAAHVKRAQKNLPDHWGVWPDGKALTRLTDAKKADKNRKVACKGFKKKNKDDSCDEYPFATTWQGAAIVGKGHYSIAHVPLNDNKSGGGVYSAFLKAHRVFEKDRFYVSVS